MLACSILLLYMALFTTVPRHASAAIVDLLVIQGDHSACPEGYSKVAAKDGLNGDFNQGTTALWPVYLCVKNGNDSDGITDLNVVYSSQERKDCNGLDHSWFRISQQPETDGNFHSGRAFGHFVYLCAQKAKGTQPLIDINLHSGDCDSGMFRIKHSGPGDGNFDQDQKDKYLFICVARKTPECTAKKVQGQWIQHGVIAAAVTETWEHGTKKTDSSTKTSQWSDSVSVKVSQGWTFAGEGGSVEISSEIAHQTSATYKSEWSVSDTQQYQITWGKENIGKESWQFQFEPTDSCGNTLTTYVKEFAITEGAWRPPCCVPGYMTDGAKYLTCHSEDVMVKGWEAMGCKVASKLIAV